jgi:hypothetical protein
MIHTRRLLVMVVLGLMFALGAVATGVHADRRPEPTEPSPVSGDPFEAPADVAQRTGDTCDGI